MTADDRTFATASLIELMTQAVIATDLHGSIRTWNPAAEGVFGWTREEAIGSKITQILPAPSQIARAELIFETLRRGHSWSGEFTVRHRSGEEFNIFGIGSSLIDRSQLVGVVAVITPLAKASWPEGLDRRDTLTPREMEIATLTAEGKTSAEIAAQLHVAIRTVESHRFNIYRKLGIKTRAELTMLALRNGLLK